MEYKKRFTTLSSLTNTHTNSEIAHWSLFHMLSNLSQQQSPILLWKNSLSVSHISHTHTHIWLSPHQIHADRVQCSLETAECGVETDFLEFSISLKAWPRSPSSLALFLSHALSFFLSGESCGACWVSCVYLLANKSVHFLCRLANDAAEIKKHSCWCLRSEV